MILGRRSKLSVETLAQRHRHFLTIIARVRIIWNIRCISENKRERERERERERRGRGGCHRHVRVAGSRALIARCGAIVHGIRVKTWWIVVLWWKSSRRRDRATESSVEYNEPDGVADSYRTWSCPRFLSRWTSQNRGPFPPSSIHNRSYRTFLEVARGRFRYIRSVEDNTVGGRIVFETIELREDESSFIFHARHGRVFIDYTLLKLPFR